MNIVTVIIYSDYFNYNYSDVAPFASLNTECNGNRFYIRDISALGSCTGQCSFSLKTSEFFYTSHMCSYT